MEESRNGGMNIRFTWNINNISFWIKAIQKMSNVLSENPRVRMAAELESVFNLEPGSINPKQEISIHSLVEAFSRVNVDLSFVDSVEEIELDSYSIILDTLLQGEAVGGGMGYDGLFN